MAAAITRILQNPSLGRSLGATAREFVVEHRSLEAMVSGYEELIRRVYEQKAIHPDVPCTV
jgi:hypothetical protein